MLKAAGASAPNCEATSINKGGRCRLPILWRCRSMSQHVAAQTEWGWKRLKKAESCLWALHSWHIAGIICKSQAHVQNTQTKCQQHHRHHNLGDVSRNTSQITEKLWMRGGWSLTLTSQASVQYLSGVYSIYSRFQVTVQARASSCQCTISGNLEKKSFEETFTK